MGGGGLWGAMGGWGERKNDRSNERLRIPDYVGLLFLFILPPFFFFFFFFVFCFFLFCFLLSEVGRGLGSCSGECNALG